ncbi:hypothetical protein FNV43_RR07945 [Rhamnella rubrinervis]|uniref:Uncharacterized protein n=1 Tax=Rhamnella rubrinervis TaxID=2594499 RepID=A0A8K0MMX0_9ROSA|nr:hypothetical protein FNV43_RR07945 [Rhamnella rubrinervis]
MSYSLVTKSSIICFRGVGIRDDFIISRGIWDQSIDIAHVIEDKPDVHTDIDKVHSKSYKTGVHTQCAKKRDAANRGRQHSLPHAYTLTALARRSSPIASPPMPLRLMHIVYILHQLHFDEDNDHYFDEVEVRGLVRDVHRMDNHAAKRPGPLVSISSSPIVEFEHIVKMICTLLVSGSVTFDPYRLVSNEVVQQYAHFMDMSIDDHTIKLFWIVMEKVYFRVMEWSPNWLMSDVCRWSLIELRVQWSLIELRVRAWLVSLIEASTDLSSVGDSCCKTVTDQWSQQSSSPFELFKLGSRFDSGVDLLGSVASNPAWEIEGIQPSVSVNKLGLDLLTSLNVGSTKLKNPSGNAEGKVKVVYNKGVFSMETIADIKHDSLGRNTIAMDCAGSMGAKMPNSLTNRKDTQTLLNIIGRSDHGPVNVSGGTMDPSLSSGAPKKFYFTEAVGGASPSELVSSKQSMPIRKAKFVSIQNFGILTDFARGIGIPLRIDNTMPTGNYGHFARILVNVDLTGFVPETLLLKMTNNYIEVDLYFESFPDFCNSYHSVGHSMVKRKSVIGKTHPKMGPHSNEKEYQAQFDSKQAPSLHVDSTTPSMPTFNAFEVLNTDVTLTHIEDMTHQYEAIPSNIADINKEMGIEVRSTSLDLGAAPSRTEFNTKLGKSVRITLKNVWTPAYHGTVPRPITSWADAFGNLDDEHGNDVDDIVEDN